MSNKLGWIASTLIAGSTIGAVWLIPAVEAHADTYSCVDDSNRICAPNNSEGKPAGCYDDGGVLEYDWPCHAWTPEDGYLHGDGSVTYPDGHTVDGRAWGMTDPSWYDSDDLITCDFDKTCISQVKHHRGPSTATEKPRGWPKKA